MKNFTFFLLLIFVVSCEQNELVNPEGAIAPLAACGTPNPLEELDWLKAKVEKTLNEPASDYCQLYSVQQGIYAGEVVFMPVESGALCCLCAGYAVYNCKGELLYACEPEKDAKITDIKEIWRRD